jgi:hypothetical protein
MGGVGRANRLSRGTAAETFPSLFCRFSTFWFPYCLLHTALPQFCFDFYHFVLKSYKTLSQTDQDTGMSLAKIAL